MPMKGEAEICQAKSKRTGLPCKNRAVRGYKVCRMHGAGSPNKGRPGGRPVTTGANTKRAKITLKDKIDEFRSDPQLMTLEQDIALFRVLQRNAIDNMEVDEETGEVTPKKEGVIGVLFATTDRIVAAVEKWHKITSGETLNVNIAHYEKLLGIFDEIIDKHVPKSRCEAAKDELAEHLSRFVLGTKVK